MSDGKPYGPVRYEQIVKECYLISKNTHIPYSDVLEMSPTERSLMLKFIVEEINRTQASIDKAKAEAKNNSKHR